MEGVKKTREDAIFEGKIQCLKSLPIDITETTDKDWLIGDGSGRCACGETNKVEVTYFHPDNGDQYTAWVSYCEDCGSD